MLAVAAVAAGTPENSRAALFFLFDPTDARPGDRVTVRIAGTSSSFRLSQRVKPFQQPMELYLVRNAIAAAVTSREDPRLHGIGSLVPDKKGRGILPFTVPELQPDSYAVATFCPACAQYSRGRTFFVLGVDDSLVVRFREQMLLRVQARDAAPRCRPSDVQYHANKDAPAALRELPWIAGGPGSRRIVGHLAYYEHALGDARFNRSDGAVISTSGASVVWTVRKDAGSSLRIAGRRLDGTGAFDQRSARAADGTFPGVIDIPRPGCWRLTLGTRRSHATVVVQAIEPPVSDRCDPTPFRHDVNPELPPMTPWLATTPLARGFYGFAAGDEWTWVPANRELVNLDLTLDARRLDGPGRFRTKARITYPPERETPMFRTSMPPPPGCWLMILRSGKAAGVVVFTT